LTVAPARPAPAAPRRRWGIEGLAIGLALGGAGTTAEWRRTLRLVDVAEALSLHSVWLPEMHFARGVTASPLLCLAAIARRTRRLRLATTSLLLPIHHPLRIAAEIATLDHLSGGRVIVGLGRGFRAPLFDAFGIDPATKRDRFDHALDVMLGAWAGEHASLAQTPFAQGPPPPEHASTRPLQDPHPPLAVAAFGRMGLRQAARRALPYLASPVEPFDLIRENLAVHRDAWPPDADPAGQVVPVMRTVFVCDDDAEGARVLARLEAESRPPRTGASLPPALARAVAAPIEDRVIVGGVSEVVDRLGAYREQLGMNLLVVRGQVAGVETAALEASLARLVEEVAPALAS
jgi:alkanesulfonate monooxygenase SsuD/methylene tetrahydromethanopterin reductase-like flavin-dependent oxidoreductase (luciferase family)